MSRTIAFPANEANDSPRDARVDAMVASIQLMLRALPLEDQERILESLQKQLRPISAPKAGELLGFVVKLLPRRKDWSVEELKKEVSIAGVGASPKELYNALGYLSRKGHVRRVGYGRYIVEGVEIATSDDFGQVNSRHEDAYRTDREE